MVGESIVGDSGNLCEKCGGRTELRTQRSRGSKERQKKRQKRKTNQYLKKKKKKRRRNNYNTTRSIFRYSMRFTARRLNLSLHLFAFDISSIP